MEKAFWDETKTFLQSKVASVALKRGKTPVNWIFQSPTRHGCHHRTTRYVPRGETVTAAYLHKALAKIYSGFGLKDQSCLYRTCFLPGQRAKSHRRLYFQKLAVEKGVKMFSQLHFSHISHERPFILSWKWNQSWQAAWWPRAPSRRACRGSPPSSLHKSLLPPS